jgi:hypothetical protein
VLYQHTFYMMLMITTNIQTNFSYTVWSVVHYVHDMN